MCCSQSHCVCCVGADSTATAGLIYTLCAKVHKELTTEPSTHQSCLLLGQLRSILKDDTFVPTSIRDICNRLLVTSYMATNQSTDASKKRAEAFAKEIGCIFYESNVQSICDNVVSTVVSSLNIPQPKFSAHGGSGTQDRSLQNVQARVRSVVAYTTAQLFTQTTFHNSGGPLLVVGSANADETYIVF